MNNEEIKIIADKVIKTNPIPEQIKGDYMIPDDVKEQAKKILEPIKTKITIDFHENPSAQLNHEIKDLLETISSLNENISLNTSSEGENTPYFDLKGEKNEGTIRFMGIPSGHEFSTLLSSLVMVSTGKHDLSSETVDYLKEVKKPLDLKVFITPTCPHCPSATFLAQRMAMVSTGITASMVEAMEFPELSQHFEVSGVPHTIINDQKGGFVGSHPENSAVSEIKKVLDK